MKGEKTTKGNRHRLTKNQHVIPKESIKRFVADDGKIEIYRVASSNKFRGKPDNSVFCVNRVWDQRAENGWMQGIENRYQQVASLCNNGFQLRLIDQQHEIVSRMYLLIWTRIKFTVNDIKDYRLERPKTAFSPSKDQVEFLESRHITTVDGNGLISSRSITGNVMLMKIDQNYAANFQTTKWLILSANESEFVFSDSYNGYKILPISPNLCFIAQEDLHAEPKLRSSNYINEIGKMHPHFYYFQR